MMALGLGLGLPFGGNAGGGTPPVTFSPGAVLFTPDMEFGINSALGVTNSQKLTQFYWIKGTYGQSHLDGYNVTACDLIANNKPSPNSEQIPGLDNVLDNAAGAGTFRANFCGPTGGALDQFLLASDTGSGLGFQNTQWTGWLVSIDLSTSPRRGAMYRWTLANGWQKAAGDPTDHMTGAEVVDLNNAFGFSINPIAEQGYRGTFAGTQLLIDNQTAIVDASNNISIAQLAKFASASGPVDFGADGSLPLGRAPEVYHIGGKADFGTKLGVATNAMALIGTGAAFSDAPYGPAGRPAGRAVVEWVGQIATNRTTGVASITVNNNSNRIDLGDPMTVVLLPTNGAPATAHTVSDQNGWHVEGQTNWGVSGEGGQVAILTKYADAGDVTAAGVSKSYTFTWTGNVTYGCCAFLFGMKGANAAQILDIAPVFQANALGVGLVCPDAQPVTAGCTLINLFTQDAWNNNANIRKPATGNEFFSVTDATTTPPGLLASWEYLTGTTAPGTRTASTTTVGKVANCGATLLVRPA